MWPRRSVALTEDQSLFLTTPPLLSSATMDQPNLDNIFAQFGNHAPAIQNLLQILVEPLQLQINQLQQQLAEATAIADPPPPPPAPTPIPFPPVLAPMARDPKSAEPKIFSGDRNETTSFIRSVRMYIQLQPSSFPVNDEQRKILFALSYMQGGTAGKLADNHANTMMDPTADSPFSTFQDFQVAFERAFGAADRGQRSFLLSSIP